MHTPASGNSAGLLLHVFQPVIIELDEEQELPSYLSAHTSFPDCTITGKRNYVQVITTLLKFSANLFLLNFFPLTFLTGLNYSMFDQGV